MKYTLSWVEEKEIPKLNTSVLECTATDPNGNAIEFSIWKKDKNGAEFPNFANLQVGTVVEGNMWQNPKDGKYVLYAPKAPSERKFSPSGGMKMMQEKAKNIAEAQERKSESIAYFNSVNSAIALLGEFKGVSQQDLDVFRMNLVTWRDWFISEYEKWNSQPF